MLRRDSDVIAFVEGCYRLDMPGDRWLQRLGDELDTLTGSAVGTVCYRVRRHGGQRVELLGHVTTDRFPMAARAGVGLFERWVNGESSSRAGRSWQRLLWRMANSTLTAPPREVLMSDKPPIGPDWLHSFFLPVGDQLNLVVHDIAEQEDLVFVTGLERRPLIREQTRDVVQMMMAHAQAGLRLRTRLGALSGSGLLRAPLDGAVLDPSGRVVDATEETKPMDIREALAAATREMDTARLRKGGRGPEAVEIWKGLVDGRWSLVETFDTDGRRFIVAHENPPGVHDPRGLTPTEARVVGLAVRGYSDKLIGYSLGFNRSTAAKHLSLAMRKLRITRRTDLVRLLGRRFPAAT